VPSREEAEARPEAWKYDPWVLADGEIADRCSLYLGFHHSGHERVQKEIRSVIGGISARSGGRPIPGTLRPAWEVLCTNGRRRVSGRAVNTRIPASSRSTTLVPRTRRDCRSVRADSVRRAIQCIAGRRACRRARSPSHSSGNRPLQERVNPRIRFRPLGQREAIERMRSARINR